MGQSKTVGKSLVFVHGNKLGIRLVPDGASMISEQLLPFYLNPANASLCYPTLPRKGGVS